MRPGFRLRAPAHPVLALALLLVSGCSLFFEEPSVDVAEVRIASVGLSGATAVIALDVHNPNGFALDVSELRYTLAVPDEGAGGDGGTGGRDQTAWTVLLDGVVPDSVAIPGRETTRVVVEVPFEYSAVERAGEIFLRRRARLPYRLSGRVRVTGPLGAVQVPFDEEGVLDPLADILGK